jgi:hypothetical protein
MRRHPGTHPRRDVDAPTATQFVEVIDIGAVEYDEMDGHLGAGGELLQQRKSVRAKRAMTDVAATEAKRPPSQRVVPPAVVQPFQTNQLF